MAQSGPTIQSVIAALDHGAAKTACLVLDPGGALLHRGLEYPWGLGRDPEAQARALRLALAEGAAAVGRPLSVDFTMPGSRAAVIAGETALRAPVDAAAARRALLSAAREAVPEGQALIHLIPLGYRIDGGRALADPRGVAGQVLRAQALAVTAPAEALSDRMGAIAAAGATPGAAVAPAYAAGLCVLSAEERAAGALVVDLGASETGVAAFFAGALIGLETLPLGQAQLTDALAQALSTSLGAAERLKIRTSAPGGLAPGEAFEAARLDSEGRLYAGEARLSEIAEALRSPLDALLAAIGASLARLQPPGEGPRWRVALVGGGAGLEGLKERAIAAWGRGVRVGRPIGAHWGEPALGPEFAACAGLIARRLEPPLEARLPQASERPAPPVGRVWRDALGWLKTNF